ncbi:MAG: insulinase family protein [Candidatus Krumholzibacteria bacterium]|nr:insulinase family protein [Candidatus Krumholzibacteria bacterium]
MRWQIKKVFHVALTVAVIAIAVGAQAAEPRPKPAKIKKLSFPDFKEFETENGMEVLVVEHHEQPIVSIYAVFKTGGALDPQGKESLAGFTIDQLNKGTKTRSALELAEWIESVGGSVNTFSERDFSAIAVTILSDYIGTAYEYLQDVLLNPAFPEDELELLRKQAKTGLEFELSSPEAMARRHLRDLVYGDHPYGKQPSVESVEAITRDDMVAFYKKNFVPNNMMVAVVGDVKWKDVKKSLKTKLGDWQPGTPQQVAYSGAPDTDKTRIYLYHKPGAVQTEIFIGHLAPNAKHPDWPAMTVGNRILGGGSDSRLFMNIRETKGWTYHVRTGFARERDLGQFVARTPVRTEVTDSALVELMTEIERITAEPVSQEELENAKSYLVGNFPLTIETPDQIAFQVAQYTLLGLDKKDLEKYRDRIDAVTVEDIRRVMAERVHSDRAYIVLVGDATAIREKVEPVAEVALFDIAGEPMSLESMAVEAVDYQYNTALIEDRKATYALTVQSMAIGELNVTVERKQAGGENVIQVSSNIAGMITMDEDMTFRAKDLSPVSYKAKMVVGPNTLGAEFSFTEARGSGVVQSMESPEPKEVNFELVDGTILDGALEYAIVCLPLEVKTTYRFPVVDSQTGSLHNVDVEILEVVDVETPAGKFSTYKVKVKRPEGDQYLYFGKDAPHILVKQEVPAQAMNLELKSIAN